MKKKVYLDATIPSYLFDLREELKYQIETTRRWWNEESHKFELWISDETLLEVSMSQYPHKTQIVDFTKNIPQLVQVEEIRKIAKYYIDHYLMPQKLLGDSIHLAYASYYKMDFLLTWNCNHIANANKFNHIRLINKRLNLKTPELITPLELFEEKKND